MPKWHFSVGKITKKQSEGVRFCYFGTQNAVQYTPADCFFSLLAYPSPINQVQEYCRHHT